MPDHERQHAGAALRHRDFALLWSGQTISLVGNGMFTVALPLAVMRLTGSSFDLGLVVAARTIPSVLFVLAGGAFVDRLSRRTVMLLSDASSGAAVGLVVLLMVLGHDGVWQLAVLSAFFGVASAFFRPASTAIVPDLLPAELLVQASSLSSVSKSLSQYLLGPLFGGIVVAAIGTTWAFGFDAISFVVSAGCLLAMRHTPPPARSENARLTAEIRDGLRYARSQAWFLWSMVGAGIGNLACFVPIAILEPLLVSRVFHAGAVALGLMFASSGVGGALAAAIAAKRPPRKRIQAIWIAWSGAGLAAVLLGLAPVLWLSIVAAGLTWLGATYGNIIWSPLLQHEIPAEMLGRASSVDWAISLALAPLGTVAGGALATAIGVRATLILGGLVAAVAGGVVLLPGVTAPDRDAATRRSEPVEATS